MTSTLAFSRRSKMCWHGNMSEGRGSSRTVKPHRYSERAATRMTYMSGQGQRSWGKERLRLGRYQVQTMKTALALKTKTRRREHSAGPSDNELELTRPHDSYQLVGSLVETPA
jgi:hypothetical protein